ncbi:MAG TPA: hypothetical protein VMM54_13920 [Nitrospirota bacterium]|nr:hypothetical protein [Nitrospirota bacterium]
MKKRMIRHECMDLLNCKAEYMKWECGSSRILFVGVGVEINRMVCGNDHEKRADAGNDPLR